METNKSLVDRNSIFKDAIKELGNKYDNFELFE
jgi:hypothetical protein